MTKTVFKTTSNAAASPVVHFQAGETIFAEGDAGTEMYIIQSGRVEVLKQMAGEERRLAILEKGDFFGEMALLEKVPRNATVRALEKTSTLSVGSSTFDQMVRDNPEIVVRMMRKMSSRQRQMEDELAAMASRASEPPTEPPVRQPRRSMTTPRAVHKLVSEDGGAEFHLSIGSETTIGREDPVTGIDPDIDLTELDTQRTTSRTHAKLYHRGRKFFLVEEIGTSNGTFVNDYRLETGVPVEVQDGDRVGFGLVRLLFRTG